MIRVVIAIMMIGTDVVGDVLFYAAWRRGSTVAIIAATTAAGIQSSVGDVAVAVAVAISVAAISFVSRIAVKF